MSEILVSASGKQYPIPRDRLSLAPQHYYSLLTGCARRGQEPCAGLADKTREPPWLHPRLVQTGLDLVDFPTIAGFETDYQVSTMRQASRRSWRIGLSRPVKVVFMAHRNNLQTDALKLVAKKLQPSLAVEGRSHPQVRWEVRGRHWPEARAVQDWTPDVESAAVREAPGE